MAFPIQRDLVIRQGSDFTRTFRWLTGLPDNPRWRDPWDPNITFVKNDITFFDTTYYVATARNRAAQPDETPDVWDPLSPKDLTGWTGRMMARERKIDAPALSLTTTLSSDGSGLVLGDAAGTVLLKIANETTALLPDAVLAYDLELVSTDTSVTSFLAGRISVDLEETR